MFTLGGFVYLQTSHLNLTRTNLSKARINHLRRSPASTRPSSVQTTAIRCFGTTSPSKKAQLSYAMDEFDDSLDNFVDNDSDTFTPEKPVKKAAAKKATAPAKKAKTAAPKKTAVAKSDKPKAPPKPRAKKPKVQEDTDVEMSFQMDEPFDVLATPQASSSGDPSPPRPPVLQEQNAGVSKKNASETYQKVARDTTKINR